MRWFSRLVGAFGRLVESFGENVQEAGEAIVDAVKPATQAEAGLTRRQVRGARRAERETRQTRRTERTRVEPSEQTPRPERRPPREPRPRQTEIEVLWGNPEVVEPENERADYPTYSLAWELVLSLLDAGVPEEILAIAYHPSRRLHYVVYVGRTR